MFKNYLKITFRNLIKTKLFSTINILGLAIGMTACLIILRYVSFERSYDNFHENAERIYRLRYERTSEDGTAVRFASCCPPAALRIRERFPEVEKIGRIFRYRANVSFGDIHFIEERMYFAEPDFLDILKFKFIDGDPLNGIREPNKAFISRSTARKYFGDQNPMGQVFSVDRKTDYLITGVFEDIPQNSHLKFDILLSYENVISLFGPERQEAWGYTGYFTYLRLKPQADLQALDKKLADLVDSEWGNVLKQYKILCELKMQPLKDIHLTSHFMQEYEINGDRDSVNFLFYIAFFIIVMAWINYVNLSTARSLNRAKEVGLRKVVGASRKHITVQFFFETIVVNIAAIFIAFIMVEFSQPFFSQITSTPPDYSIWREDFLWAAIPIMFLTGIFLSGLYPVIVLSSFRPAAVLRGNFGRSAGGIRLRKVLVVFQFVMALVLITGTLTVYRQIIFMKEQNLGFDIDQILVVKSPRVRNHLYEEKFISFKETLLSSVNVLEICHVTEVPGRQIYWDAGAIYKAGEDISKSKNYQIVGIDYDFVDVFDLDLVCGRNFSKTFPTDKDALILNETAVQWMGFESPEAAIRGQVNYWGKIYPIIGILKDFRQQSSKEAFEPHIYRFWPAGRDIRGVFALKIHSQNTQETIHMVQQNYDEFFPGNPFDYFFLDEYFDQQYHSDELFGKVFGIFSFLAIFVTSLGILGLSSYMAIQRTKEIGIRKALGASVLWILLLLTKDFLKLIFISLILAFPLSFLGINRWLDAFSNKMNVSIWLFLIPFVIVIIITLLTVSSHVIKAALVNPAESLKYE